MLKIPKLISEFNCIYPTFKKSHFTYPKIIKSFTGCITHTHIYIYIYIYIYKYILHKLQSNFGSTTFIQNPFQYSTDLIQSMNKFLSLCCVTSTMWLALQ